MAAKTRYSCPHCDFPVRKELGDGDLFVCPDCKGRFTFLLDEPTGQAAMVNQAARRPHQPLFLPRGSIRALVALALAATFWVLAFADRTVPSYLMNLLLTIVGYYFGYRADADQGDVKVYDASAELARPLALPPGVIRFALIAGFVASGAVLLGRGEIAEIMYMEFFFILLGLLAGTVFGRMLAKVGATLLHEAIDHLKAVLALGLTAWLAWAILAGSSAGMSEWAMVMLCACISFYFGSRL